MQILTYGVPKPYRTCLKYWYGMHLDTHMYIHDIMVNTTNYGLLQVLMTTISHLIITVFFQRDKNNRHVSFKVTT